MNLYKREYSIPKWAPRPNISILVPVYNHSKYLCKSIQSILSQNDLLEWGAKLSIKVLNDGSTEPVKEYLKEYLDAGLIEYREKVNQGLPSALNDLYQWDDSKASDFRTWHSADNLYLKESLLKMTSFLAANPDLDFTFCNVQLIDESGSPAKNSHYRQADQTNNDSSVLNLNYPTELLLEFNDNFINACFLERTRTSRLLPKYRTDCKGFEDYIHWLNYCIIGKGEHINFSDPLYQYRIHEDTMTHQIGSDSLSRAQKKYVEVARTRNNNFKLNTLIDETSLPTPYDPPKILLRARNRYLHLFGSAYQNQGRVLIFIPDEIESAQKRILNFIQKNPDLGIILYSRSESSRKNADNLYLGSNLASNLRIVDFRPLENSTEDQHHLLNALGSVDVIISINCFLNSQLAHNFHEELVLGASSGRVVLAPEICKELSGPLANHYPWSDHESLPPDIKALKTDLSTAHYDAILRHFSAQRVQKLKNCC